MWAHVPSETTVGGSGAQPSQQQHCDGLQWNVLLARSTGEGGMGFHQPIPTELSFSYRQTTLKK